MRLKLSFTTFSLLILAVSSYPQPQLPPRLQIPGALPLDSQIPQHARPVSRARARAPPPQHIPLEVRPVNEELEDLPSPIRLIPAPQPQHLQYQQQLIEVEPEQDLREKLAYRPERPAGVQRQLPFAPQQHHQQQQQQQQQRPVIRTELKQQQQQQNYGQAEIPHLRRPQPQAPQQPIQRPAQRPAARPAPQYLDDDESHRTRKPPVQILRKYRTDNADGSITWGYENEDGSFKEENIGIDCITRGKYGYVDPDGVKREYSYETGGTCEEPEDDLEDLPPGQQQQAHAQKGKKTYKAPVQQYVN